MRTKAKTIRARKLRTRARRLERQGHFARARNLYVRSAQLGDARAQSKLRLLERANEIWTQGSFFEDEGNIAQAIRLYGQAARLGNTSAMLNLANLFDDYASPRKPEKAIYWYKRAVKAGNYTAAYNLGIHYRNLGNKRWHKHWLQVAAKMGDPDAKADLRRSKTS